MSQFSMQILKDTTTAVTVKFTGFIDAAGSPPTSDPANTTLVVSMLRGAYDSNNALRSNTGGAPLPFYGLNVHTIQYTFGAPQTFANAAVTLNWRGSTTNSTFFQGSTGQTTFDLREGMGVITSDAVGTGANCGEIFVSCSAGLPSGTYTIILAAHKNPAHFDKGYLVDPRSFSNP